LWYCVRRSVVGNYRTGAVAGGHLVYKNASAAIQQNYPSLKMSYDKEVLCSVSCWRRDEGKVDTDGYSSTGMWRGSRKISSKIKYDNHREQTKRLESQWQNCGHVLILYCFPVTAGFSS